MLKNLEELIKIIKNQKNKNKNISYTASLIKKGKMHCINKFMEEAKEFAFSAKHTNQKHIIHEAADLFYHLFVLLELKGIPVRSIMFELKRRQKFSGLEEKKSRKLNVRQK
jgi:phosphoribosyl-ATP pyrophosphohydrolase